jgi:polysaccharide export outer membrane protein
LFINTLLWRVDLIAQPFRLGFPTMRIKAGAGYSLTVRPACRVPPGVVVLALVAVLAGCSALPASGPTEKDVKAAVTDERNTLGYRIVDISPAMVAGLPATASPSLRATWGDNAPESVVRVGVGDVLAVTVFVTVGASGTGNEFAGAPNGTAAGMQSQTLPPLRVNEAGQISIPYASHLPVAGKSPVQIEALINEALSHTVYQPQALVTVTGNLSNTVLVSGDVRTPGRVPLQFAGERLLSVLDRSGGPLFPPQDVLLRMRRKGRTVEVRLRQVLDSADENIPLWPGDTLDLVHEPRTFLAFGAAGRISQVPFEQFHLSLAEGMAKIGGPADDRADPEAVYLFRYEEPDMTQHDGNATDRHPVIYRVNMLDPQSYLLLQKVAMHDKDVVFVANAATNKFYKLMGVINSLFAPASMAATARVATQ